MIARIDKPQTRFILLVIALLAIAIGLDGWQRSARRRGEVNLLDSAISTISKPLQQSIIALADFIKLEWTATVRAREITQENQLLRRRVAELENILVEAEEERAQQERLNRLMDVKLSYGNGIIAQVIAISTDAWSTYLTLDRGYADGVRVRQVAISSEGIVGQVYAVTNSTAKVIPLTEQESAVAVLIQRSRETGILKGLGSWQCEIRYLDPEADVLVGDLVITSGLGGIFPKGLTAGRVTSIRQDERTPGQEAEVEPSVNLTRLEEVLLITSETITSQ